MTSLWTHSGRPATDLLASLLGVLLLGFALGAGPVAAAEPTPPPLIGTRLTVSVPSEVTIGTPVEVSARLTTLGGNAIGTSRVTLQVNGVDVRTSRTDADGVVTMSIPSDLLGSAGSLAIRVAFAGDATRRPSTATATLVIRPAVVKVTTVPAVEGMTIGLEGQTVVTDAQGVATFAVTVLGRHRLAPSFELPEALGKRVSFVRWQDDSFDAERTIDVSGDDEYVLGLRVAVRTRLQFVDLDGAPVDPKLVQTVVMDTGSGPGRTVSTFEEVWLDASVPVKRTFGLIAVPNLHRVSEVRIAGTNTVNRGQQVWEPTLDGTWTIQVLLFHLDARIEDALLGSAISTEVTLEFPDGTTLTRPTDAAGVVSFGSLPRGDYRLLVRTGGLVPPSPIAMSRPQDITIRIITTVDLAIGGGLLIGAVATLLLLGRRHQIAELGRSGRRSTSALGRRLGGLTAGAEVAGRRAVARSDAWLRARAQRWARTQRWAPAQRWARASAGLRASALARRSPARLSAIVGIADRAVRTIVLEPRRRAILAAAGLVVMALVVLATAGALVGATSLP